MEEEDAFLRFVESAKLMLLESSSERGKGDNGDSTAVKVEAGPGPSWGWVCRRILECCKAYSSGVTPAILFSNLFKAWLECSRVGRSQKSKERNDCEFPKMDVYRKRKQLHSRLPNIITIDSIFEKKFVSLDAVLEVVILDIQLLSGTSSYLLTLGDAWSANTIDFYVHRRFYDLIDERNGVLRKGREIRLTGCRLRTAVVAGSSKTRLLPTEYLVILLDEEQDEDALLLGARFCADTFSSIQLDSVEGGADCCFYARLEEIGEVEIHAHWNHVKRQKLFLCDGNGTKMPLVLWDEQLCLTSLFSEGSMIAIERPFLNLVDCQSIQPNARFMMEYGSASRLYTVPYSQHEEQVMVGPSQSKSKTVDGVMNLAKAKSQDPVLSQVFLPTDSQGSIDYCSFPVRLLISDVHPKMSNISLYGVVRSVRESRALSHLTGSGGSCGSNGLKLILADESGCIVIWLHSNEEGKHVSVEVGHTIFISGLKLCSKIHKKVCKVFIKNLKLDHVRRPMHAQCRQYLKRDSNGSFKCRFCAILNDEDIVDVFTMVLTLYDSHNGVDGTCFALCYREPATEILQAQVEEFSSWPEDEQALYLYSLQKEQYLVTLYNGTGDFVERCSDNSPLSQDLKTPWRIGQALKCEV